jgi:hypothetical protein
LLFYAVFVVGVHLLLTPPVTVVIAVALMSVFLLVSTILAALSLRSMSRSVRTLDRALDLPRRLSQLREVLETGSDQRSEALASLVRDLAETGERLPHHRAAAALHRLRAMATAVQRQPEIARLYLAMPRATVDDGYRLRSWLHLMAQVLLYSGIVATLYGLFVSFNNANLSALVTVMLTQRKLDPDSFRQVVTGFTVAFGASAFGYVAFLCSRIQQEIVDEYSADLALLLDNDLSEAVTRAFAPLAVGSPGQPLMRPGQGPADIEKVIVSVTQASEALQNTLGAARQAADGFASLLREGRQEWEKAANIWKEASERFAAEAGTAASAIGAAAASVGGTAREVGAAANTMVGAADHITVQLANGAEAVNRTLEDGLNRILEQTNSDVRRFNEALTHFQEQITNQMVDAADRITAQLENGAERVNRTLEDGLNRVLDQTNDHVGRFNAALIAFREHISHEVADFREAHEDATRGRGQLHAAITLGHDHVRAFAQEVRRAIGGLAEAERQLSESVQGVGGTLRGELIGIRDRSQSVADGLEAVQRQLDQLIRINSGERVH